MKRHSGVYMILIVLTLFIQQIISGCATTVTKEELIREAPLKEEVVKEAAGPDDQKLYEGKCSPCHVLPDIGAYGYTADQWVKTIDGMHNPADYSAFVSEEEDAKIKAYLKSKSQ